MTPAARATRATKKRPPTTSTLPSASVVAVRLPRAMLMEPTGVQLSSAGSYTSALSSQEFCPKPPTTSTRPSSSLAAAWS